MQRQRQSPSLHVVSIVPSSVSPHLPKQATRRRFNPPRMGVNTLQRVQVPGHLYTPNTSSDQPRQWVSLTSPEGIISRATKVQLEERARVPYRSSVSCRANMGRVACASGISSSLTVPAALFPRAACTQIYSLRGADSDMPTLRLLYVRRGRIYREYLGAHRSRQGIRRKKNKVRSATSTPRDPAWSGNFKNPSTYPWYYGRKTKRVRREIRVRSSTMDV